ALMSWLFCASALPPSLSVGCDYASFFRLSGAIKIPQPICAFIRSFGIIKIKGTEGNLRYCRSPFINLKKG
ncbi:MAG: hypothetical protein QM308_04155, partial [Bacillota bacterium]|nr:hypothetical protein [Bacillota bacterium]